MLERFWMRLRLLGRVLTGKGVVFRTTLEGPVYFPQQNLLVSQSVFKGGPVKCQWIVTNGEGISAH